MASPALRDAAERARATGFWGSPAPWFLGVIAAVFVLGALESRKKKAAEAAALTMQGYYR